MSVFLAGIGHAGNKSFIYRNQQGQAVVFVLALLGIVFLSVIFLYRSGQLTSEKMQLQNAADAAAYSATTLEARALNFAAYTNRAMIGNEVAIGQMVGLLSLSEEWIEAEEAMNLYLAGLAAIPIIGEIIDAILEPVFGTIADILGTAGQGMKKVLDKVAGPIIRGLSTVNEVYSVSQQVYHVATFALASDAILKCLEDNTPGTDFHDNLVSGLIDPGDANAQLSGFGLIALAGHLPSYLSGFTRHYRSGTDSEKDKKGMGRLAATIREGRDAFSSGLLCKKSRKEKTCISNGLDSLNSSVCCDANNPHCISQNRAWHYGFNFEKSLSIWPMNAYLDLSLEAKSKGGSELRYKDKRYVWSAVDTAVLEGGLSVDVSFKKKKHKKKKKNRHKSIKIDIPLGAGTSQATGKDVQLTPFDMPRDIRHDGKPGAYGGAAGDGFGASWLIAQAEIYENQVGNHPYPDLRPYRDVTGEKSGSYPFEAPYFFVGVIRKIPPVEKRGPQFGETYRLEHGNRHYDRIAAVAKSEVYFSRPDELSYFRRKDKYTEKPNVFSPFWQSRLVQSKDIDRFLALALQQKIIWISDADAADIPGAGTLIKALEKFLDTIL